MDNNRITGLRNTVIEVQYLVQEKQFVATARGISGCTARGATPEQAISNIKVMHGNPE